MYAFNRLIRAFVKSFLYLDEKRTHFGCVSQGCLQFDPVVILLFTLKEISTGFYTVNIL